MSADSAADVSGPVARITGFCSVESGIDSTSPADNRDERVTVERVGDGLREALPVDGQGGPGGHPARFGGAHDERAEAPHLFFQEADGVIELVAAERIAADELSEAVRPMDGRGMGRPHFVQRDGYALRGGLPRRLGTREPPADNGDTHEPCGSFYAADSGSASARA